MEYKLFEDVILLQSLLKDLRIIPSGGAIKPFLAETTVLLNGEDEKRRRKQLRLGDTISIPSQDITITLVAPTEQERVAYEEEKAEKERVAALVKQMNQSPQKAKKSQAKTGKSSRTKAKKDSRAVRFPGR